MRGQFWGYRLLAKDQCHAQSPWHAAVGPTIVILYKSPPCQGPRQCKWDSQPPPHVMQVFVPQSATWHRPRHISDGPRRKGGGGTKENVRHNSLRPAHGRCMLACGVQCYTKAAAEPAHLPSCTDWTPHVRTIRAATLSVEPPPSTVTGVSGYGGVSPYAYRERRERTHSWAEDHTSTCGVRCKRRCVACLEPVEVTTSSTQ
ncbi:hypothetical protein L227DRAFT_166253 [Lentinus tigrinus ALCF2SS1-6]|uniref:Uncharacterized protein n=2 Tax=Lentinus tigrinus TaxID=5365 RepID=A0A5C2S6B2_9APHY|nr:hypothetical protein L227DRAFT_166253 [Lentinus tigrinus ALCF2SS1-6]